MIETLESPSAYKISTVNDNRFVTAAEIAGVLHGQEMTMCSKEDKCGMDYASCDPNAVADTCGIDFA
jgi:hypothetical protein